MYIYCAVQYEGNTHTPCASFLNCALFKSVQRYNSCTTVGYTERAPVCRCCHLFVLMQIISLYYEINQSHTVNL